MSGRSRTSVEVPMSDRDQLYLLDQRAWLLAIGRRLRVEYDAIAEPVPPRLAALVKSKRLPKGSAKKPVGQPWLQTIRSGHVRTGMKTGRPDHGPDSIEPYQSAAGYRHPQVREPGCSAGA